MKKGLLLLLLLTVGLSSFAQKVTLNYQNVSLETIFAEITKQTGLTMAYSSTDVDTKRVVSVNAKNQELSQTLTNLLNGTSVDFEISRDKIYLTKKIYKPSQPKSVKVIGKIVSPEGNPIVGAAVSVEGTNVGAITNIDGEYEISAKSDQKLSVSYIGYETKTLAVTDKEVKHIVLTEESTAIDDVVVVGYRKSLRKAIDIKQKTINAVDAIVAEDIAKFPQSNVSEALQRVSGIQIVRDDAGGVGNQVSIRGMGAEYTQVTIDGDAAANSSSGETYNFNTLPAEVFSRVEVSKAPTAKMTEGGVGGTVDLIMRKPFDLDEQILVVSAEGQVNTQQQTGMKLSPKASVTYGNNWNNKFGIIAGATYNNFSNTSEGYDVVRYYQKSYDLDKDGEYEHKNVRVPLPRYVSQGQNVDRLSLNFSAQYQLRQNMNIVFSGLWNRNANLSTRYSPIWFLQDATASEIIADGPFVEYIMLDDAKVLLENQIHENISNSYQASLKFKWYLPKNWAIGVKGTYSLNTADEERFRYYASNTNKLSYDVRDNRKYFQIATPTNYSDASQFKMSEARHYLWDNNDNIYSAKLDATKKFNKKINLEFGYAFDDRTKDREYYLKKMLNINEPFAPVGGLLTGFMDNVSEARGMTQFLVHDFDKAYDKYGSKIDLSDARQVDAYYDINQRANAGYVMANFKSGNFKANAGTRYINTRITSKGLEVNGTTGEQTEVVKKNSYDDILPSVNLSYEPVRKLFVKASYARVMTRPKIQDLSSYMDVNDVMMTISAKNPNLKPFRANQYDLSFEWYPREEIMLSASAFLKDIESFITTQTRPIIYNGEPYELRQPVNGNDATVSGVELNYQQPFTFLPSPFDGFGVVANYTLSLSDYREKIDGVEEEYTMPGNSKHSYNLIGYYEKYGFGIRAAYNYRSSYLREKPNPDDGLKYRAGFGQLDISASYDINSKISVTANVLNALDAQRFEYIWDQNYMDNISIAGITAQLGIRIKL